jgi:hypothetical protein
MSRTARCFCGQERSSDSQFLAFLEDRGEGSKAATEHCKHCGYFEVAHGPGKAEDLAKEPNRRPRRDVVEEGVCPGFEPHGAYEFDTFYCGCRGWD